MERTRARDLVGRVVGHSAFGVSKRRKLTGETPRLWTRYEAVYGIQNMDSVRSLMETQSSGVTFVIIVWTRL